MDPATQLTLVALALGVVAFLYSSVGHGGASGYIAVLTLAGFLPKEMRPIALTLNILVASIGSFQFWRAGHFSWKLIWPFVVLSVPLAFLGGYEGLPIELFKRILGGVLFASAARLFIAPIDPQEPRPPRTGFAIALGGGIGLLSGLTGTGGGIFLTPLLLICRWAKSREAAAVSALFVLVNSIAGLSGYLYRGNTIPSFTVWFAIAAVGGGTLGSQLGSTRLSPRWIHLLLATALIVAGFKLMSVSSAKAGPAQAAPPSTHPSAAR